MIRLTWEQDCPTHRHLSFRLGLEVLERFAKKFVRNPVGSLTLWRAVLGVKTACAFKPSVLVTYSALG